MVARAKLISKLYQAIKSIARRRFLSWLLSHILHHVDTFVWQSSHHRYTLTNLLTGLPVVILTTIGAKTGKIRSTPLVCQFDEKKVILIASSFGKAKSPGWYYNLIANPRVNVIFDGRSGTYLARETEGAERERYWQGAVAQYAGFADYQLRAGGRKIPVIVLESINPA